jgi:hypothetical protein
VSCALQFWDAGLSAFRTYSEFCLSEQHVTHLDLPITSDRKKVSVSEKWRIVIDHQVTSGAAGPLDPEKDFFSRVIGDAVPHRTIGITIFPDLIKGVPRPIPPICLATIPTTPFISPVFQSFFSI